MWSRCSADLSFITTWSMVSTEWWCGVVLLLSHFNVRGADFLYVLLIDVVELNE